MQQSGGLGGPKGQERHPIHRYTIVEGSIPTIFSIYRTTYVYIL